MTLGFGLHCGWAIEGSIGSEFKIDASYLSPNASLADRMEALTKFYKVHLLLSNTVYDRCSEEMKADFLFLFLLQLLLGVLPPYRCNPV